MTLPGSLACKIVVIVFTFQYRCTVCMLQVQRTQNSAENVGETQEMAQ